MVRMYREAESTYSPEVRSAWLHHRFTQIHPFQDGNGRVARALASLVFLREGLFPLVVRESDRVEYIGALETADAGDCHPWFRSLLDGKETQFSRLAMGITHHSTGCCAIKPRR